MKDKNTAALLALFLGGLGAHKFYLNRTGMGILYLLFCWTLIPAVGALIEAIALFAMNQQAFDVTYNGAAAVVPGLAQPQNIVVNVANTQGVPSGQNTAEKLKALHDLKVSGALTEDEFNTEKRKLLTSG